MTLFTTSRPTISVKSVSRFPARVTADTGLAVTIENGTYNFAFDFDGLNTNTSIATPADWTTLVYNTGTGLYEQVRLDAIVDYTITPRRSIGNTNATISADDRYVALTASLTTPRTWTLPAANSVSGGVSINIQDEAGGISSTNTLTISRAGSDTVNGSTSVTLNTAYDGATLYSDGTSKWTLQRRSSGLTVASGKTLTANNTLTLSGTDGSSVAFGSGGTVAYTGNKLSAFAATTSSELAGVISDETGSGALVFGTGPTISSPTLVTPTLGTPSGGTLTNCSGLPVSGISGLGTNVATALGNTLNASSGLVGYSGAFGTGTATKITFDAGTTSVAPIILQSGTNLTTPAAGAHEYDGTVFYKTPKASNRGVDPSIHFVILTSSRTLTSNTNAQAIFAGGGGPTNGELTLKTGTYIFDMVVQFSGMSSSSHTLNSIFAGTATYGTFSGAGTYSDASYVVGFNKTGIASTTISIATTSTSGAFIMKGAFTITAEGTVIPQISQSTNTAAAKIDAGSYFKCFAVGSSSVNYVGNWS